ncbi:MAG: LytTR family DNA-binding domain-containing protein [Bacteroidota bacterium]
MLQTVISILIGYPLLVLAENAGAMGDQGKLSPKAIGFVLLASFVIGLIGTEGQRLADALLFATGPYVLGTAGGVYIFNGILSVVLGFMTVRWFQENEPAATTEPAIIMPAEPLTKVPYRKGDTTILLPLAEVTYFEAYDNYAFLHTSTGERHLCNYSLAQLAERLPAAFQRVHRKYLINTDHVTSISPHLKGRYVLTLGPKGTQTVRSSASYAETVRELLRL